MEKMREQQQMVESAAEPGKKNDRRSCGKAGTTAVVAGKTTLNSLITRVILKEIVLSDLELQWELY